MNEKPDIDGDSQDALDGTEHPVEAPADSLDSYVLADRYMRTRLARARLEPVPPMASNRLMAIRERIDTGVYYTDAVVDRIARRIIRGGDL